jgi:hypothetical protein
MEKCVKCDKDTDDWFKFAGNDGEPQTSCRECMEARFGYRPDQPCQDCSASSACSQVFQVVTVVSLVGIAGIAAWACWKNKE